MTTHPVKRRKKLIEVAIPLEAINEASAREKSIRHGHPSTLHLWWARRPLAAARAVIFCQMVDDPSAVPEEFPTEEEQERERLRLFALISKFVLWESTSENVIWNKAAKEIRKSWIRCCKDNASHPQASDLFNQDTLPTFHDPFSGGGSLPLEAKRLGLQSLATDLNPVAVLINRVMLELPGKTRLSNPVLSFNPDTQLDKQFALNEGTSSSLAALLSDFEAAGNELLRRVKEKCMRLYESIEFNASFFERSSTSDIDYSKYKGKSLKPLAWLWARTVKCSNPACQKRTPLLSTFCLSKKKIRPRYLHPHIQDGEISFTINSKPPLHLPGWEKGYKRANSGVFACAFCGSVTTRDYVAESGKKGELGLLQTAIVLQGDRERVYVSPSHQDAISSLDTTGIDYLNAPLSQNPRDVWCRNFGLLSAKDLFIPRQLVMLDSFVKEIAVIAEDIREALAAFSKENPGKLDPKYACDYADSIITLLALSISRMTDYCSSLTTWANNPQMEIARSTFARQALPMTWDFAETNPFANSSGSLKIIMGWIKKAILSLPTGLSGSALQGDATCFKPNERSLICSTDPPYFDNIGYADLSDYFYPWLRKMLGDIHPDLFPTIASPKTSELVALPYRHANKADAEVFFLNGMRQALSCLRANMNPAFPLTIYYAFKQTESKDGRGAISTGWETFLEALIDSGYCITSTWPMRTERSGRSVGIGTNALATSIVLSCAAKSNDATNLSKSEFRRLLRQSLSTYLRQLERLGVAPVDIAQAAIGPGMSIYSQARNVMNTDDSTMSVREALLEINAALDEALSSDECELDADSRFILTFFESYSYQERDFGDAENLAKARNVSVSGVADSGALYCVAGKVRLLRRSELEEEWDPANDKRLSVWEATQQLIRRLENRGEDAAALLLSRLKDVPLHGDLNANCRALAYRLYNHCEKTKQTEEARAYNGLVIAWPELERLAASQASESAVQTSLI